MITSFKADNLSSMSSGVIKLAQDVKATTFLISKNIQTYIKCKYIRIIHNFFTDVFLVVSRHNIDRIF